MLALKNDVNKVIDGIIHCSKIKCVLLISKIVQKVSNISKNVNKQINKLKNENREKNLPVENTLGTAWRWKLK